jgi:(S)-citramalyl-CoA lyase
MSACKFLIMGGLETSFKPAFESGAGIVCLDLEDTVSDAQRPITRSLVRDFLALGRSYACEVSVRISALSSEDGLADLTMLLTLQDKPDSLVLAKPDSAEEVAIVSHLLHPRHGTLPLDPIIETARALAQVRQIAAVPGVNALVFGGKDLSNALRVERSWEPLLYARSRCSAAAAEFGLALFDEPFSPREDLEGVRSAAISAKALGFTGKAAVVLPHVSIINDVFG